MQEAHCKFHGSVEAPRIARSFAISTLFRWGRRDAMPRVEAVVSELVTNAFRHAEGPIDVRLELSDDCLRVEVVDQSPTAFPMMASTTPPRAEGYGLHVVNALTKAWGCDLHDKHKTVWAKLDLEQPI